MSAFETLAVINVNEWVEKKGRFSYLSWADAVDQLCKACPDATWEVHEFPMISGEWHVHPDVLVPYLQTPTGFYVKVSVTVDGLTKTQVHPVLDNYNKPVKNPSSFDINTSIQRALAKAIALHGLGLYIFRGEDFPTVQQVDDSQDVDNAKIKGLVQQVLDIIDNEDPEMVTTPKESRELYEPLSNDERIALQTDLKTVQIGRKTAWSIFREYLTIAAK